MGIGDFREVRKLVHCQMQWRILLSTLVERRAAVYRMPRMAWG